MFVILLTLHIIAFAMSLALTAGTGIAAARVARGRDAKVIHAVFKAIKPLTIVGGIGWFVTGGLGAWVAAEMGASFTATWMVLTYVIFAVLVITGFFVHSPWHDRVIEASSTGMMTPTLDKLLSAPTSPVASAISALCVVALTYLMIAQPG